MGRGATFETGSETCSYGEGVDPGSEAGMMEGDGMDPGSEAGMMEGDGMDPGSEAGMMEGDGMDPGSMTEREDGFRLGGRDDGGRGD